MEKVPSADLSLELILAELAVDELLEKFGQSEEKNLAIRLLYDISLNGERGGWTSLEKKDYALALIFFKISLKSSEALSERRKYIHYGLACVRAQNKNPEEALNQLKKALESGFSDGEDIRQNTYLDPLRNLPAFKEIVKNIKETRNFREFF